MSMSNARRRSARRRCLPIGGWQTATLVLVWAVVAHAANDTPSGTAPSQSVEQNPIVVSEADNGRTIRVARSTQIRMVLHSTYWQLGGSSDPAVLAPMGVPEYHADRGACLPGGGCGTVSQSFTAVGEGRAQLQAKRTVCGEALPCATNQGHFAVSVRVGE
jgi:hypothetical protein